jgi:hypothetical protein
MVARAIHYAAGAPTRPSSPRTAVRCPIPVARVRALRLQARRLHRRRRGPQSACSSRPTAAPVSRRDRRNQPGVPGQAAARAAGGRVPAARQQSRPLSVDVRVIAATNHDLEADVRAGAFARISTTGWRPSPLHVPPLRERAMDIPLLAGRLLDASCSALGKVVTGFSTEALPALAAYPWPGNVRELQNEILRMLALPIRRARCRPALAARPAHAGGRPAAGRACST